MPPFIGQICQNMSIKDVISQTGIHVIIIGAIFLLKRIKIRFDAAYNTTIIGVFPDSSISMYS
jgi:hypothetical protein